MRVQVKKVGGSLLVHIPPDEARRLGLEPGEMVDVSIRRRGMNGDDVLRLLENHPWTSEVTLEELREVRKDRYG